MAAVNCYKKLTNSSNQLIVIGFRLSCFWL